MGINVLKPKWGFNWKSRNLITRIGEQGDVLQKITESETVLESYFGPLQLSKIEIHYFPGKVVVEIRGTILQIKKIIENKTALKLITEYLTVMFNISEVELLFQTVPTLTFTAEELAKLIRLKLNKNPKITEITKISRNLKKLIFDLSEKSKPILGIRIEVKGLSGKMARSIKINRTIGTVKLNSTDSIISAGSIKSINKKGIIGIKVWISYRPHSQ